MRTIDTNLNVSDQYIQARRDIGSSTYYNLNTQTTTVVPWGSLDWVGALISPMLMAFLVYGVGHFFRVW